MEALAGLDRYTVGGVLRKQIALLHTTNQLLHTTNCCFGKT